jgi:hypothetical protein
LFAKSKSWPDGIIFYENHIDKFMFIGQSSRRAQIRRNKNCRNPSLMRLGVIHIIEKGWNIKLRVSEIVINANSTIDQYKLVIMS